MGIPAYFSHIIKNHASIIKKIELHKKPIHNLYLDSNSIIYDAIHKIDFTTLVESDIDTIIRAVCNKIEEYIFQIKPTHSVFIAFDGVAPVAKMAQQRERRYKSLYTNLVSKSIYKKSKPDAYNTTCITPGTHFMNTLNNSIRNHFGCSGSGSVNARYQVKSIKLSLSDEPGEGEHKIFSFLRDFEELHRDQSTVVYGLDADLIMLCLNHLPISNQIYLFRETPHFLNSDLEPDESYLLDIPELARAIVLEMNNGVVVEENTKITRIYDYIFMCFFLGNDFMPHFPSINIRTGGIDKMMNAYKATLAGTPDVLTDGKRIFWGNVRKLVHQLATLEETHLKKESKLRERRSHQYFPDETPDEKFKKFDILPSYQREIENYIDPFKHDWQSRYYKSLFEKPVDLQSLCMNYLQGLEWNMKYYTTGCADWRWSYAYNYPPLLADLMHFIPLFERELVPTMPTPNPVSALVQLSYVLPKQSLNLLPEKVCNALLTSKPHWYRTDCDFAWSYCRYFWEAHVELPSIDIDELETFVVAAEKTTENTETA